MHVLHLSLTEVAGMPMRISRALRQIGVSSEAVAFHNVSFSPEVFQPTAEALIAHVKKADFIHCHCANTYARLKKLILTRPCLLHIHGAPERGTGYKPEIPHVLATPDLIPEFPNGAFMPNVILPEDLPVSTPVGRGPVRVFKSPSLHDKHHELFAEIIGPMVEKLAPHVEYVAPKKVMKYPELVALRQTCHISFDHLHGYFGLESLESLAQGLIAINGSTDEVMNATQDKIGAAPPFKIAHTPKALAQLMVELLKAAIQSPMTFDAMRSEGRRFIETQYAPRRLARGWVDIYAEIITTGGLKPEGPVL